MMPALAQGLELGGFWAVMCALTMALPGSGWDSSRNWSETSQMSPPPPCTFQVPAFTVSLPAGIGLPMSAQVQPPGQDDAGVANAMLLNCTVLGCVTLCEVTARPARMLPVRAATFNAEPGTAVQVVPSGDVYAVNVVPARPTLS